MEGAAGAKVARNNVLSVWGQGQPHPLVSATYCGRTWRLEGLEVWKHSMTTTLQHAAAITWPPLHPAAEFESCDQGGSSRKCLV